MGWSILENNMIEKIGKNNIIAGKFETFDKETNFTSERDGTHMSLLLLADKLNQVIEALNKLTPCEHKSFDLYSHYSHSSVFKVCYDCGALFLK